MTMSFSMFVGRNRNQEDVPSNIYIQYLDRASLDAIRFRHTKLQYVSWIFAFFEDSFWFIWMLSIATEDNIPYDDINAQLSLNH